MHLHIFARKRKLVMQKITKRRRLRRQSSSLKQCSSMSQKILETESGFNTFNKTSYREIRMFCLSVSQKLPHISSALRILASDTRIDFVLYSRRYKIKLMSEKWKLNECRILETYRMKSCYVTFYRLFPICQGLGKIAFARNLHLSLLELADGNVQQN